MRTTKIEWTEKVWNPSIGCSKVSAGCKFCYAEIFARRLQASGIEDYKDGFSFKILSHRLNEPLKTAKPTKYFVNSMSDLFHEKMPFYYLDMVFDIIKKTPYHIYQILTKRDKIMLKYFSNKEVPSNVWLGVSVENSDFKNRIDSLRNVKANIRFISFEPLIGLVGKLDLKDIHWAIVGGESGIRARPIRTEWIEEIFHQCKEHYVAFFFKQWGAWGSDGIKRNKKTNGRIFKDKIWNEYPTINKLH